MVPAFNIVRSTEKRYCIEDSITAPTKADYEWKVVITGSNKRGKKEICTSKGKLDSKRQRQAVEIQHSE